MVVVFPTPPFWLATAMTRGSSRISGFEPLRRSVASSLMEGARIAGCLGGVEVVGVVGGVGGVGGAATGREGLACADAMDASSDVAASVVGASGEPGSGSDEGPLTDGPAGSPDDGGSGTESAGGASGGVGSD